MFTVVSVCASVNLPARLKTSLFCRLMLALDSKTDIYRLKHSSHLEKEHLLITHTRYVFIHYNYTPYKINKSLFCYLVAIFTALEQEGTIDFLLCLGVERETHLGEIFPLLSILKTLGT